MQHFLAKLTLNLIKYRKNSTNQMRVDAICQPWESVRFASERSRVRIPSGPPKREAKKDIEDKTSVFSRLPRPVDQQIYGPYFSDILPCAIHSGRSRTHTIFTLSGISFEAGILLLQDLGLFYSAVETDSPNRKQKNVRLLYGATIF